MSYRLSLQGVSLAEYTLGVGDVEDLGGTQVVLVQGHAKTIGFASFVAKIDDTFSTWIDVKNGRTVRYRTDEYEVNSKTNIEHTIIDLRERKDDLVPVSFHLNDRPPQPEPQKVSLPELWDVNSFLIALRSWEGAPGTTTSVEAFRSRYIWHLDVRIGKREKIVTELEVGEMTALRFDARTYKLTRAGGKDTTSDERNFSIWISDDDGRVPLQIVARTDYGDMKMQITDYQPGNGQRLRP
ncbi:MAG: DUF3108 domain-containing protein [Deltaproteobacteria bacterium]|nr:DUF3108 domain-containing protein [Deltaproteobacteria bacterium]MCW5802255.1 DUF3108 domain-containing protein [Deltaproteobacteria bacterium]